MNKKWLNYKIDFLRARIETDYNVICKDTSQSGTDLSTSKIKHMDVDITIYIANLNTVKLKFN